MFSQDKNIETIASLVEELKEYFSLKTEYFRFNLAGKVVHLLTVLISAVVLMVLMLLAIIFFSFAVAHTLAAVVGTALAFAIVGVTYLIIFLLFIIFRKSWIERPLVRVIAAILLGK